MPLHLLGKKSWNVYNTDNVERVRRDEADARAREEAAEQLMQEQDAERRIALLRGEEPPAVPAVDENEHAHRRDEAPQRERKRKRLKGEDDTEREMRYAREDAEAGERVRDSLQQQVKGKGGSQSDAPLHDRHGHIQLVSAPEEEKQTRKSDMSREEKASQRKKEDEEQQQHGMRFSDAAGYRKGTSKPWYTASDRHGLSDDQHRKPASELALGALQGKDVWGNEDPRRIEREQKRITSNDPFAMMQQAQHQLKRSEGDRAKWQAERDSGLLQLKKEDERKRRHEKKHESRISRRRDEERDELEGFSLNGSAKDSRSRPSDRDRGHDGHRRHRHSRRHRSRERSPAREHRRTYSLIEKRR